MLLKKYLFLLITFLFIGASHTQDVATFKVVNYEINGENIDHLAESDNIAVSFYACSEEILCFTIESRNQKTQSYGKVIGLTKQVLEETDSTYKSYELKFNWKFVNSYDDKRGDAVVSFTKIYMGEIATFHAVIVVLSTNEKLTFKGYLE